MQRGPEPCGIVSASQLSEDLALPDHHRIKTAREAEQMPRDGFVSTQHARKQHGQVAIDCFDCQSVDLDAMTAGQRKAFARERTLLERLRGTLAGIQSGVALMEMKQREAALVHVIDVYASACGLANAIGIFA